MDNRNIQRLFNVVDKNLMIIDSETDETTWWLGESNYIGLADFITGAYWHYTEWHGGQSSQGYAALSALGQIYEPNMECVETDNEAYQQLNIMAA